jgi:hypothetical protein
MADRHSLANLIAEHGKIFEDELWKTHVVLSGNADFQPLSDTLSSMRGPEDMLRSLWRTASMRDVAEIVHSMAQRIVALEKELSATKKLGGK